MHPSAFNPLMLIAGLLFSYLLGSAIRRGSVSYRFGTVSREKNPVGFWCVAGANALIVLAAFLMAFGILGK